MGGGLGHPRWADIRAWKGGNYLVRKECPYVAYSSLIFVIVCSISAAKEYFGCTSVAKVENGTPG